MHSLSQSNKKTLKYHKIAQIDLLPLMWVKSRRFGGLRRVGSVGASSTLAACVGLGVLFASLVILRVMVWKLRQTENRKGNKPMTDNNRKMFAACTLDTICSVGTSAASATLLA